MPARTVPAARPYAIARPDLAGRARRRRSAVLLRGNARLSVDRGHRAGQAKRWVVVEPAGGRGARLLLAKASTPEQVATIGRQTGGRVFLFLYTDDFWRDYARYRSQGVVFVRPPEEPPHGVVAVFEDLCGNAWDLTRPDERNRSWPASETPSAD